jgi:hypothetical protein
MSVAITNTITGTNNRLPQNKILARTATGFYSSVNNRPKKMFYVVVELPHCQKVQSGNFQFGPHISL